MNQQLAESASILVCRGPNPPPPTREAGTGLEGTAEPGTPVTLEIRDGLIISSSVSANKIVEESFEHRFGLELFLASFKLVIPAKGWRAAVGGSLRDPEAAPQISETLKRVRKACGPVAFQLRSTTCGPDRNKIQTHRVSSSGLRHGEEMVRFLLEEDRDVQGSPRATISAHVTFLVLVAVTSPYFLPTILASTMGFAPKPLPPHVWIKLRRRSYPHSSHLHNHASVNQSTFEYNHASATRVHLN
ncbi:hypothetical protein THAOC_30779 [Thalassiosira oceanica]|uniref:Uncharacterized protein n=1 Tax=Thalassiosira oceanica TaxID=159749 RepID=K0RAP8_THAOC|nr:hypothetical protein THAOC_30779 [Thalassiosira oceanica]|eukprot:EJK50275.1 hypothetical protein THAOC_30779 [Thalassiosira oceanica]